MLFRIDNLTLFFVALLFSVFLWPRVSKAGLAGSYQLDWSPIEKSAEDADLYKKTYQAMQTAETREGLEILIRVVKKTSDANPDWLDGKWLVALHSVTLAATYTGVRLDFDKARTLARTAEEHARACLKVASENVMCRYALAVSLGTLASINGIMASLKVGKEIQEHLIAVEASKVDFDFGTKGTMQENVLHTLGMFRRLVPDSAMIRMIFGIRGNLEEALQYHAKANSLYKESPCSVVMTGAAEYCLGASVKDGTRTKAGLQLIERASKMLTHEFDDSICIRDAPKLLANNKEICTYTRATLAQ